MALAKKTIALGKRKVDWTAPTNGQVLQWNASSSAWVPTTLSTGLGGRNVATTAPTDKQIIQWNNGASEWQPADPAFATLNVSTTSGSISTTSGNIVTTSGAFVSGASPGSVGQVRLTGNSNGIVIRNAAGSADIAGIRTDASNYFYVGSTAGGQKPGITYIDATSWTEILVNGNSRLKVESNGIDLRGHSTQTSAPTGGGAGALPATPTIYVKILVGGTQYWVPCYTT
jgi:hypothetical protein